MPVDILLSTYNGELYIEEQIKSILNQLSEQDEIIISDDHSKDATLQKINSFQDERIKLFTNTSKKGPVGNFENALKQASGDVIFLADQDDVWFPDKIKIQLEALNSCDLVLSDAIVVDEKGTVLYPSFFKQNFSGKGLIRNWVNNSFIGCCMAFNRNILEYILPFPEKIAMHDSWIGLNASLIGKCSFINQPLVYYKRHGSNTMASFKKTHLPVSYQISYRLYMMYHVLKCRLTVVKK